VRKPFALFRGQFLSLIPAILSLLVPAAARAGEHLLDISASNITDVLSDVQGGLRRGTRVLDKADVTAAFLGPDHGVQGFSAFVDGQVTDGANFSGAVVGDAQTVSNIDGPSSFRLVSAWIAQDFGGRGGIKAGVVDLNTEFDVQATGALFLNSSFGIGPDFSQSGQNGPSIFPTTGLGLVGWWLPAGHWQLKAGLFEGAPGDPTHPGRTSFTLSRDEGVLMVLEARNHLTPDFVVGGGTWRYTAPFDAVDPARDRLFGNAGYYAIADGLLYAAPEGDKAGLSGWVRIGFADDRINPIDAAVSGGFVYTAPFGRMADQAGISFARAQFGTPARRAANGALGLDEMAVETAYSFNINSHLTVQPDVQYVISPGGDPAIENALVIGSRFIATW
jgi:porin